MADALAKVAVHNIVPMPRAQMQQMAVGLDMVQSLDDVLRLSQALAGAGGGVVPKHFQNAAQIAAIMLAGREMGVGPMASLRAFFLIEGKLGMDASFVLGRMIAHGVNIEWLRSDDKGAVLKVQRGNMAPFECAFLEADAKNAGLLGKQNWNKYPVAMYRARAATAAARAYAPDAFGGAPPYTFEEAEEAAEAETTTKTSPARLLDPELKATINEQATARQEARDLAAEWIVLIDGIATVGHLESWLALNGFQLHNMPASGKGKVWTAIQHACDRVGMTRADAKKMIAQAEEYPAGEPDASEGEVADEDLPEPGSNG